MSYTVTITEVQQGVTVTANTDLVTVTETSQPITVLVNAVEFATGVTNATINGAGNLIITLSNSTQLDAGQVVTSSTYGNTTVAAYLPTYSGSIGAATEIVSLTANAGAQSNQITGANAAIITANTAMKSYVDAINTSLVANDAVQTSQILGANAAIVTANTAMKNYVDAANSTQSTQITTTQSWVTGANAAIVTANTAMKAYVDANAAVQAGQITTTQSWVTGANAAIVTANTAMKNYVDAQTGAVTSAWTANAGAQANQIAGANAAIVTANVALKGYVDQQFTNLTNGAPAILDTLGEIATSLGNNASLSTTLLNAIAGSNAAIVTANTAMKSYVDAQITTTQGQITTANTALKSYVDTQDSAITSAWTANAGVQADAITALQSNAGAQANQIAGANAAIVTANTALKAYTDDQITTANTALKSYVDTQDSAVTSAWTSNAGVQADAITALQSNAGAQANQIAGANVNIARIDANLGSFQTYANATYIYSNSNVASYLPVYGGTIYALNITGVPGENLTLEPGGTGDVQINADTLAIGDNNVDTTITTRGTGNLLLRTHNADTTEGNITLSHGANGNIKLWPNGTGVVESAKAIVVQGNVSATYFLGDGSKLTGITAGTTYGDSNVATYLAGSITVGNIASTSGYFWANGTAYSTGTSFTGNLVTNSLTASGTGRILANASPQANVSQVGSYTQAVLVTNTPSYIAGNLIPQNQTVSMATLGNVNLLTTYANATLRTTNGTTSYLGVTATSANTSMNPSDRVRGMGGGLDLNLNGKSWGLLSSASNTLLPIVTNGQTQNIYGTGQIGQAAGVAAGITITPVAGSISAQYVSSLFGIISYAATGGGSTASNINTARLVAGTITATGNLTVTNAIGLHTYSGWVSSNVSLVTNAYTVLNEDTRSIISTVGNIAATGALSAFGNTRVNGYLSPNKNYYDTSTTANIVVTTSTAKSMPFQQIALNANATIYSSALGFDTVYDFSIQQDGTGGRTLGWFQTGGAYTPVGVLNPAPNSVTYGRAIMSDTGFWTVSYSNASVPVLTVIQTNAFTGMAGSMVAVSNGTGKNNGQLAYWDVTNTRWSWVDTNLAVS